MRIIGILGGVASGKSLVAEQLRQLGAELLDGDRAGHEVLRLPEVVDAVRARWGDGVIDASGEVDRKALGRIVFAPTDGPAELKHAELKHLEQITHPRIGALLKQRIDELAKRGAAVAVLDATVMLKSGWDEMCDKMLFVDVPREQRLERARRRGWSEEDFKAREDAQESLHLKRDRADVMIDNSGSPEATRDRVERFWHSYIG